MIFVFNEEYEYKVEVFCPKCGSSDVVIEVTDGFFHFSSCNRCGYRLQRIVQPESVE